DRAADEWRYGTEERRDAALYDLTTDLWTKLPDLPLAARRGAHLAVAGDRAVLWGGAGGDSRRVQPASDGAVLDLARRTWQVLPAAPIVAGSDGVAAVDG